MHAEEDADTIKQFVIARTPNNWISGDKYLRGADRRYWIPGRSDIRGILSKCRVAHQGSQGDVFDCDDYAYVLKSRMSFLGLESRGITGGLPIAFGIYWGRASWAPDPLHAGNWFVTRENDLVWIEPQFNNAEAIAAGKAPIRPGTDSVTHLELMAF